MSLTVLRKCPIDHCRFNKHAVLADRKQTQNHILHAHDYKEKLEVAFKLGIISTMDEHRSPQFLAENLVEFSADGI